MKRTAGFAPRFGGDVEDSYLESYAAIHEAPDDTDYRIRHAERVLVDGLLGHAEYDLCEIGCGTGGYFRLYAHARRIVGVDYSQKMIDRARQMAERAGWDHVEFACSSLEEYAPEEPFDAVVCRVVGHYLPHDEKSLGRLNRLLKPGGLLLVSQQPPLSLSQRLRRLAPMRLLRMHYGRIKGTWEPEQLLNIATPELAARLERNGFELRLVLTRSGLSEVVAHKVTDPPQGG